MPVISVVMPVYRRAEYLPAAIESILNQTFGDFELICVDGQDGGEECKSIIQDYAAKDARVQYIVQDGVGVSDARNTGLNSATGEYFAAHDSDNVSAPQRLQKQLDFLKDNQEYAAVVGHITTVDEAGERIIHKAGGRQKDKGIKWTARSDLLCYRSSALAAGGYRSFFINADDLDFALRFLESGFATGMINEDLYFRRNHNLYSLTSDYPMILKYRCIAYYCAYCRKVLGKDSVDEGKSLEEMQDELGDIHLPIKDALDDSIVMIRFKEEKGTSLSYYFLKYCVNMAKRAKQQGNHSDYASIIQFMENCYGTDKGSRILRWRVSIHLLRYALRLHLFSPPRPLSELNL